MASTVALLISSYTFITDKAKVRKIGIIFITIQLVLGLSAVLSKHWSPLTWSVYALANCLAALFNVL